jgi:hypothetical protein
MIMELIFLPIFIGLSAVLTVIVADLLSPKTNKSKALPKSSTASPQLPPNQ